MSEPPKPQSQSQSQFQSPAQAQAKPLAEVDYELDPKGDFRDDDIRTDNPHIILRVVSKFLIPLIAVFALYVQFHGDFGPGGGFQAGVIFAAAIVLYALIFGMEAAKRAVPPSWIRVIMTVGVLTYGGTGVVTWLLGGEFLNYSVLAEKTYKGQHYGIIAIELGVLLTVASVMVAIFYAFGSRTPEISDEDW